MAAVNHDPSPQDNDMVAYSSCFSLRKNWVGVLPPTHAFMSHHLHKLQTARPKANLYLMDLRTK